jgi:hypothetical protein
VGIFANIPASPLGGFSRPGASLWSAGGPLPFDDFKFDTAPGGTGDQGWYDPLTGQYVPNDHNSYFQINLTNITDPFIQQKGTIYWLGISIDTTGADGWKTADLNSYPAPFTGMHYEDDAVFRSGDGDWRELHYPSGHPRGGQSIDLAFVITTPEPASMMLILLGLATACPRPSAPRVAVKAGTASRGAAAIRGGSATRRRRPGPFPSRPCPDRISCADFLRFLHGDWLTPPTHRF